MTFESITEIWTYRTQGDVAWEHYRNLELLHSTGCSLRALQKSELISLKRCRLRALQKSELIALTICRLRALQKSELIALNDMSLNWTMCRLRALQKSELIALKMSFESITEIWSYCTQRDVVWEHYEIWTYCTQRDVVWEHDRNLNLLHSTRCRLGALQKAELIALNDMSFESITEIWTYCINDMSFESITEIWTYCTQRDVVLGHYRNLNVLHWTRCRLRALQISEHIALNEMSFESITEI